MVPGGQSQLGLKFSGLGLHSVSQHVASAFISSPVSSGFGSAEDYHLEQTIRI